MNIKILVVVDSIDVNDSSGSKANVALIHNLAAIGYEVKVYHYTQKKIELPSIECVSIPELKWNIWYLLSRSQRIFTRYTKININPLVEKLFGFSFTFFNDSNSIRKALEKEKTFQPYWVLTLSKAASFRPHKALLGIPKWHAKWLAYVHDPYPEHCYPRPYDWVEPGHQFKRNFFLQVNEKAYKLIYPSQYLAEWMESYYPPGQGKSEIIPHQLTNHVTSLESLPEFFNPNHFNILHAGNMMSARNPTSLILAFEKFLNKNPEAQEHSKLLFVGVSSDYDKFIKEKQQVLPQLFLSDGYLKFEKVMLMQKTASVNVIIEAKGFFSPFLPGKFPHCVAADKPILLLGPYYSEARRLLDDDYPYWSTIDNIDKISLIIETLYNKWVKSSIDMKLNRNDLDEYLSIPYLASFFQILKTLDK